MIKIVSCLMKKWLAVLLLFILIIPTFVQPVKGDGIPITKHDVYSTLRENRQFAYVTVLENSETIDLFLNVASLEPNENITVVVPLQTQPFGVAAERMTDKEFMSDHNFDKIDEIYKKQTEGLGKLGEEIGNNMRWLGAGEVGGPGGFLLYYIWTMPMLTTGAGGITHYEFEGVSVDIHSFNSSQSLKELYESLNLAVPENVDNIISKYQDYSIALVNTTTKPPIAEDEFNALQTQVPEVMDGFKNYVKKHSETLFYTYGSKKYEMMYYGGIVDFGDSELNSLYKNISNYTLRRYFYKLVLATYGLVEVEGFQLSISLPLYNGQAYFPLGTSPSWGKVSKIKIIFECPDDKEIAFSKDCKNAYYNSKHYSIWEFNDAAPDYDLEGKIQDKGFGTSWDEFMHKSSQWTYDNSGFLSILCILLMFILWWFAALLITARFLGWKISKLNVLKLMCISGGATFLCMFLSLFFAVPIIAYIVKRGPDYRITKSIILSKERRKTFLPLKTRIGTIFIIAALIILLLGILFIPLFPKIAYVRSYSEDGVTHVSTIPLGSFMVFASPYLLLIGYCLMWKGSYKFSKRYKSLLVTGLLLSIISAVLITPLIVIGMFILSPLTDLVCLYMLTLLISTLISLIIGLCLVLYLYSPKKKDSKNHL